jgi:histidine ammonia-lyase
MSEPLRNHPRVTLGNDGLDWSTLQAIARDDALVFELAPAAGAVIQSGRAAIEHIVATNQTVYGINTGFGKLARVRIATDQLVDLQHNLLRSHAVGLGSMLPRTVVRLALALRAATLAQGVSGVRPLVIERLLELFNLNLTPCVPEQGSVGASGDLAPLAHLALPLLAEGELQTVSGEIHPAARLMREHGLEPLALQAKEGLALINGTQVSLALLVEALVRAERLVKLADVIGAMTTEALKGTDSAFAAGVIALRPHPGAMATATNLRSLMADSPLRDSHRDCDRVQDPYSLRCMPQVHGASRDALSHACAVARREARSVTDNPLLLDRDSSAPRIVSAGNFHGQPLALAADYATIALAELTNISACRIEQLVNPDLSRLPPFLVNESGLNSGLMIAQVAAAAVVSENKTLAHPASVDSIPTSAEQEDHVSMSTFAARKCRWVADNLERVLAIEVIAAAQGIDFHRPLRTSPALEAAHRVLRTVVPFLAHDRTLKPDVDATLALIRNGALLAAVESELPLVGLTVE